MNLFQIIYALLAMSLIKPAEKFFRDMFGMNGKVAGTASHESGKAFMDATAKLVKDATIAISTGGASIAKGAIAGGAAGFAKGTGMISKAGGFIGGFAKGAKNEFIRQDNFEKLATFKNSADGFQNGLSAGVADAGAKTGFFGNELREHVKKKAEDKIQAKAAVPPKDDFWIEYFLDKYDLRGAYGNPIRERNEARSLFENKWSSLVQKYGKYKDVDKLDMETLLAMDDFGKKKGIYDAEKIIKRFEHPANKTEEDEIKKFKTNLNNRMEKFSWDGSNQNAINSVATKDDDIEFLADKIYREQYKGKFKDEQREKGFARRDAEIQLRDMAEKFSYFETQNPGVSSLHNMMTFEKIANDKGWKTQKEIVENFDEMVNELNTNNDYKDFSDEIEKTQSARKTLKQNLELEVQNSLTGTVEIMDEDGNIKVIDSSELLLGGADEIIKSKVDMIMERYKRTNVYQIEDWSKIYSDDQAREKNIKKLTVALSGKIRDNHGSYEVECEDGKSLNVTGSNIYSTDVRNALKSKLKYSEANSTIKLDDKDSIDLLNRLEHTKVTLEKNNIKGYDAGKIIEMDKLIEDYRAKPENQRFADAKNDPNLSDELRKVLGAELKARK